MCSKCGQYGLARFIITGGFFSSLTLGHIIDGVVSIGKIEKLMAYDLLLDFRSDL